MSTLLHWVLAAVGALIVGAGLLLGLARWFYPPPAVTPGGQRRPGRCDMAHCGREAVDVALHTTGELLLVCPGHLDEGTLKGHLVDAHDVFDDERTLDPDVLYGRGHRPSQRMHITGAGWETACRCSPNCTRADDDSRRLYPTAGQAGLAAAQNLIENEHGPSAREEATA